MKGCIRESIWDCRTKEHADSIHVQRRHLIPAGSQRRHQLISGFAIDLHRLRGWYGSRGIGSWTSALAWLWKINKTNIVWETHDALKLKGNPMNAIDFETTVAGHYTSLRREGKNCVRKERADFATGVASFVLTRSRTIGFIDAMQLLLHVRVRVWGGNVIQPCTKFQRSSWPTNSGTSVEKVKMSPTNANGKGLDPNIFRITWHTATPFWAASDCHEALRAACAAATVADLHSGPDGSLTGWWQ